MAKSTEKKRVTRRTVIEETGDGDGEIGGGELELTPPAGAELSVDPDELDGIAKLRALAGGESLAKFEVRRVMPSANAGYVGTLGDEELTMERLADEYGPGTYTIRVRLPGGKFAGSDRVQIAELPKHRQPPPQAAAPVVSAAPAGDSSIGMMMQAMQRSTEAQVNMLSGMVKSLIERPLPTPPAPPPPPDTIQILTLASKLFDRGDKGGGSFDQFMKGVEFGKEIGGGGETDMGDLLLKGMEGLKDLSAANPPQPRRRLPAPGTVPAIEGPAAAPVAQQQAAPRAPGVTMNPVQLLGWLNKQVQHLLVQASRRKSPELYAEVFLDNLPPGLDDESLLARLKAPDAIDQLAKLDKRVLSFRTWFEEFRDECVRMIEEGPDDETDDDAEDEAPDAGPGDLPAEFPAEGGGGES